MPPPAKYEYPALDKAFVSGFDEMVLAYPIVEYHLNPNGNVAPNNVLPTGYPPALLSAFAGQVKGFPFTAPNIPILTAIEPYDGDQRAKLTYRRMPAPWVVDIDFNQESDTFVFTKKRVNVSANIKPSLIQTNGSGCSVTLAFTGALVTGGSLSGGTDYPDYFGIIIQNPTGSAPLVTATAYGTAVNGVPNAFILTNGGRGYAGSETAVAIGDALVEVDRKDIDDNLGYEIVTIMQMTWEEQTSIGIREPEIFVVGMGTYFQTVEGVGSAYYPYRNVRTRTVPATVLHWLSIGETRLPLPASRLVLKNGATVINSDSAGTSTSVLIWNPILIGARLFLGLTFEEVITDTATYSGSWENISFGPITIEPSVPGATQYLVEVAAGDYALKNFESIRMRGNIFSNVAVCFPLQ